MEKKIIQITSGRGSAECCRAVAKIERLMTDEARRTGIEVEVLDNKPGAREGTLLSATLLVKGKALGPFIEQWQGTIQWIAQSPYRNHKRKNWFVGVSFFDVPDAMPWDPKEVSFETCRASGPGGQHVNKVETAVRGTHLPSGMQVLASDSRSQLENKKLCLERLKAKVLAWQTDKAIIRQQKQWQEHNVLERGNAIKTISAEL